MFLFLVSTTTLIKATIKDFSIVLTDPIHTAYSKNNMGQKCEGNCGLWVLKEIGKRIYPENLKKIVGAVWELPAK